MVSGRWLVASEKHKANSRGFSLLETMLVITVFLILASISMPFYQSIMTRSRETVLRQDLFTMRKQIDLLRTVASG